MACETFREVRFQKKMLALIKACTGIIKDYQDQDLRLTLRQAYYQLVVRNIIKNQEKSYKMLGRLLSDARLAGMVDWDAIEDRTRAPWKPAEFTGLPELVEAALRSYRRPRWAGQDCYCELWVEKDALAGVLRPLASKFHVALMVNRGYSSQSAMYVSAQRFKGVAQAKKLLFYLGDHDPSGLDMVRDVQDRLDLFGAGVHVQKLALTQNQIEEYQPPPNPAKMKDTRAAGYVALHGKQSWEVDALPPDALARIVTAAFESVIDAEKMQAIIEQEKRDKAALEKAVKRLR